jgi:hypothetical protein
MMDGERLAEIRKRERAATPSPWHATQAYGSRYWDHANNLHTEAYHVHEAESLGDMECSAMLKVDADFIAASRDDIPWLLSELQAAAERAEQAEADLAAASARAAAAEALDRALEGPWVASPFSEQPERYYTVSAATAEAFRRALVPRAGGDGEGVSDA